jgi:hypothetical protein
MTNQKHTAKQQHTLLSITEQESKQMAFNLTCKNYCFAFDGSTDKPLILGKCHIKARERLFASCLNSTASSISSAVK